MSMTFNQTVNYHLLGIEPDLEKCVSEQLKANGYTNKLRLLGSGHTRDAYTFLFERGDYKDERVVKIPKRPEEIDQSSITTLINLSKGDVNRNEVKRLNDIRHKNIIKQLDAIELADGRIVTVEEHFDGVTLDEVARFHSGAFKDDNFKNIFEQVIDGLEYLNEEKGVLHRDIKPSNIFMNYRTGEVKIGDLQNARSICDIEDLALPTRGGTPYTHPELINALLNGKGHATKKTEVYALGATMYHALTGKNPFNYKLVEDSKGIPVAINEKVVGNYLIVDGDNKEKQITKKMHTKNLEKALINVPKRYRALIKNCLSFEEGYESIRQVRAGFEEACRPPKAKIFEGIGRYLKVAGIAAVISLSTVIGVGAVIKMEPSSPNGPTLSDLLRQQEWVEMVNDGQDPAFAKYVRDGLKKGEFEKHLDSYKKDETNTTRELIENADFMAQRGGNGQYDRRICLPLLRSFYTCDRSNLEFGEKVIPNTFLPEEFVKRQITLRDSEEFVNDMDEIQKVVFTMRYLHHCYKHDDSVADLYVKALCTKEEVAEATARAQSEEDNERGLIDKERHIVHSYFGRVEDHAFVKGFRQNLPESKRNIIDRAIALYLVSDQEGKLHFEMADQVYGHSMAGVPGPKPREDQGLATTN